jgi:hypothetical protein
MWKVLLIIMRATDGRWGAGHRLKIGKRVPEIVSVGATNNKPKETNQ